MIIDSLEHAGMYILLSSRIKTALDYLRRTDFASLEPGKYEIESDNVFAIVSEYNTKDISDAKLEGHRDYIDVQYVVKGSEYLGYAPLNNNPTAIPYDPRNDILFFEGEKSLIAFTNDMFAILYPSDLHAPGIKIGESAPVKKVVVKVKV
jgi:YhcH/YjgK/YiaL family protein